MHTRAAQTMSSNERLKHASGGVVEDSFSDHSLGR